MKQALFLLALMAGPAAAQAVFTPPAGCSGILTIQGRSCLLTNVWTCESDPEGHKWVAIFNETGPFQIRKVDSEFQWLTTYFTNPSRVETMVQPAPDPENLTELFRDMLDIFDFTVTSSNDGSTRRITGFDRLTGESTVIDGETLLNTEYAFESRNSAGNLIGSYEGRQFVSEKYRIFMFGRSWNTDTPDQIFDATPIDFTYPGEPGFFALKPIYDCGAILSSFPIEEGN